MVSLRYGMFYNFICTWTFPEVTCQLEQIFNFEDNTVRICCWMQSPKRKYHCSVRGYLCPHFLYFCIESHFAILDFVSLIHHYPIRDFVRGWIGVHLVYGNCHTWSLVYVNGGIAPNYQGCQHWTNYKKRKSHLSIILAVWHPYLVRAKNLYSKFLYPICNIVVSTNALVIFKFIQYPFILFWCYRFLISHG